MLKNKVINTKSAFIWNIMGSLSTAIISVILLMVVSRFLTTLDSDRYVFAYSLANLLVVIGLFQVRNFQATDIEKKYSFTHYFLVRLLSCFVMIVITFCYIMLSKYDSYKSQVIFYVTLYRLSDAISDLFQGLFQQHERLDIAGKSLTYRNILIFIPFTFIVARTQNLLLALKILCLLSYLFIIYYDVRKSIAFDTLNFQLLHQFVTVKKAMQLIRDSFPLFINGFLIIYIYNQPKYSLETMTNIGKVELGSQTIFNILFMPAFVMNLMMLFFRPVITEMAIDIANHQLNHFKDLQKKLFFRLLILSLSVIVGSGLFGIPFLEILYGIKLHGFWLPFMLIMIGGAVGSFATAIDNILTAMRKQKLLLIPYLGGFLTSLIITNYLVEHYQIFGASFSFVLTMTVWLLLSVNVFKYVKRKE